MINHSGKYIRIAVTGPESTGKTTLAIQLTKEFDGLYIPEFARNYVENLGRHYTFEDVETIARAQLRQYSEASLDRKRYQFFDTWLIITKVWFRWVYDRIPDWLDDEIRKHPVDFYLLCRPDLPWEADAVRENGGENRLRLYEEYRSELLNYGYPFAEVEGSGDQRLHHAIEAIRRFCDHS